MHSVQRQALCITGCEAQRCIGEQQEPRRRDRHQEYELTANAAGGGRRIGVPLDVLAATRVEVGCGEPHFDPGPGPAVGTHQPGSEARDNNRRGRFCGWRNGLTARDLRRHRAYRLTRGHRRRPGAERNRLHGARLGLRPAQPRTHTRNQQQPNDLLHAPRQRQDPGNEQRRRRRLRRRQHTGTRGAQVHGARCQRSPRNKAARQHTAQDGQPTRDLRAHGPGGPLQRMRNLQRREPMQDVQDQHTAVRQRQTADRPPHLGTELVLHRDVSRFDCVEPRRHPAARAPPMALCNASSVGQDAKQPRHQRPVRREVPGRLDRGDKGLRNKVLCLIRIGGQPYRRSQQPRRTGVKHRGQRLGVAARDVAAKAIARVCSRGPPAAHTCMHHPKWHGSSVAWQEFGGGRSLP